MSPQFHKTGYGRTFFEGQLPELLRQLKRIADALDRLATATENAPDRI